MTSSPKCLRCQTEMQIGFIIDRGDGNYRKPSTWIEGAPVKSFWMGTKIDGLEQREVKTFRCPNCGYLESYAT